MRVVWSPTARRQAQAAVDYIALDRPQASVAWLEALVERVELLGELPEQGRVVPEWHESSVREVFHEPYRVMYEVTADRLEIIAMSHFRQELPHQPPGSSS